MIKPKTFSSQMSLEDRLLEAIRQTNAFKMLAETVPEDFNSDDIDLKFMVEPAPQKPEIERCVTDSPTKAWTRKPMAIPSKNKGYKLKESTEAYSDDPTKARKVYHRDIE
jgi:hypothetical protein